jgi:predicted Zn-ribbon and HTH transcriptional regulator
MKDQILKLRAEGKTYTEIQNVVGCSRSLIAYYVSPNAKQLTQKRQIKNRFLRRKNYKMILGGKCQMCGYNKCLDALQFHHKDPSQKQFIISDSIFGRSKHKYKEQETIEEVKKCTLLCANCHYEIHSKNDFTQ